MSGVDIELASREEEQQRRIEGARMRQQRESARRAAVEVEVELSGGIEGTSSDSKEEAEEEVCEMRTTTTLPAKIRKTVLTPEVAAALDRTKVSDRNAMYTIASTAKALGHDVNNLVLSSSTIRRRRRAVRCLAARDLQENFHLTVPLIIHWDGKLIIEMRHDSVERIDRIPTVVSGCDVERLLLQKWHLCDSILSMYFDTTASNTGRDKGACVLLGRLLGRGLYYLACRHHIAEVVVGDVAKTCFGPTSGPDQLLFKRFQDRWVFINRAAFEDYSSDGIMRKQLQSGSGQVLLQSAIASLQVLEAKEFFRDDYKEFMQISLTFLGCSVPTNGFRKPGAFHHARWMAKMVYAIKIWLFRSQFHLTRAEIDGSRRFCLFATVVYARYWFEASVASEAALADRPSTGPSSRYCCNPCHLLPFMVLVGFGDRSSPLRRVAVTRREGYPGMRDLTPRS